MTEPPCTPPGSPTPAPKTPALTSSPHAWKDTPKVLKMDNMKDAYTSDDAAKRYIRYAEEAQKWIVGPMPVQDFLNNFLNAADDSRKMAISTDAFKDVPSQPCTERELYEPLIAAFNTEGRCPSVKFCETSQRTEERGKLSLKPDIMGYDVDDKVGDSQATSQTPTAKTNFGLQEIVIEVKCPSKNDVKRRRNVDPFCDSEKTNEGHRFLSYLVERDDRAKTNAKRNLGQIVAYAVEAFRRQHRTHCFSILIVGTRARFIRWDRAGAIVTQSFDYKQDSETLCHFLWQFHLASAVQRGFDPTVATANEEEEALFEKTILKHVALQLDFDERDTETLGKAVERHYQKGKVTKILVFNEETQAWEEYIISRPITLTAALAGRATRGYWCVKKVDSEGEIGFLKDTWRVEVTNMQCEDDAYDEMLNKDGDQEFMQGEDLIVVQGEDRKVIRVSELHVARDVPENPNVPRKLEMLKQCSRTHEFVNDSWVRKGGQKELKVTPHKHYRLIMKDCGYPLSDFSSSRELFKAAEDVLHTLALVYEKKGKRMHRDVSLGNIILVRKEKNGRRYGVLIDWEFSTKADRTEHARDYRRSGTWAFMSVNSLEGDPSFRHSIADDFESLFYVLIYCSVRWLSHESYNTSDSLGSWIYTFFHSVAPGFAPFGGPAGGLAKDKYRNHPERFTNRFRFKNTYIQEWYRVAYKHLNTMVKDKITWTANVLQEHFHSIHDKLEEDDRCENDLGENYEEKQKLPFATYTSLKSFSFVTISGTSAGSKREFSDFEAVDVLPTEDGHDKKRPRTDDDSIDDPDASNN